MSNRFLGWGVQSIHGNYPIQEFFRYKKDAVAFAKYNVSNHPEIDYKTVYRILRVEVVAV